MADFAQIRFSDNIVIRVVVINDFDIEGKTKSEQEDWVANNIDNKGSFNPNNEKTYWKRTWLTDNIGIPEKRYNGAGPGMYYDSVANAFYQTSGLYPSWVLNTNDYRWYAPVAQPPEDQVNSNEYLTWNELELRWEKREIGTLTGGFYWSNNNWIAF